MRIKKLRESKGLTQEDLAKKIGVTPQEIDRWENGEDAPTSIIVALSLVFNCSVDYLLEKTDDPQQLPPPPDFPPMFPIVCPRCGSPKIAFVTEYHREHLLRILERIFTFLIILILAFNFKNIFPLEEFTSELSDCLIQVVILLIIQLCIKTRREYIESRTHIQAICRDCCELWLLN